MTDASYDTRWQIVDLIRHHYPDIHSDVGNSFMMDAAMSDPDFAKGNRDGCMDDVARMIDGMVRLERDGLIQETNNEYSVEFAGRQWAVKIRGR